MELAEVPRGPAGQERLCLTRIDLNARSAGPTNDLIGSPFDKLSRMMSVRAAHCEFSFVVRLSGRFWGEARGIVWCGGLRPRRQAYQRRFIGENRCNRSCGGVASLKSQS